jgi:hypothetical protein
MLGNRGNLRVRNKVVAVRWVLRAGGGVLTESSSGIHGLGGINVLGEVPNLLPVSRNFLGGGGKSSPGKHEHDKNRKNKN